MARAKIGTGGSANPQPAPDRRTAVTARTAGPFYPWARPHLDPLPLIPERQHTDKEGDEDHRQDHHAPAVDAEAQSEGRLRRHRNDGLRKVWDCARRSWAKCAHPWHFSFKWAGTHHRFSFDRQLKREGRSKSEVAAEADKLRWGSA